MKIYLLILFFLFFSCSNSKQDTQKNILSKNIFEAALKEIHLAEGSFELNKRKGREAAKNKLTTSYLNIYKKYGISKKTFEETLDYYSENADKLEHSYTNILKQLNKEKSKLDQKETN